VAAALAGQRPTSSVKVPAASRLLDHPRTIYLRQADLPPHLDGWLTGLLDPADLDATLDALIAASQDASGTAEALRKVQRALADCQRKLARYRAALDAGTDLATVTEMTTDLTFRSLRSLASPITQQP
jgi:site-specific DNA recombinase